MKKRNVISLKSYNIWLLLVSFLLLCLVQLLLAVGVGVVSGKTLYVDNDAGEGGDGSLERPFQKIQDAVDTSEDGDTVRVWEGMYEENLVMNTTVSLIGNGSANTTIDGGGEGDVVRIEADWCNVSGFEIQNSGSSFGNETGVRVQTGNTTIVDNTISNNSYGIDLSSSSNTTITGNTITWNSYMGIDLWYSNTSAITSNTISNNFNGIFLWYSNNTTTITDNTISNNSAGIYLYFSSNTIIMGNTISKKFFIIFEASFNLPLFLAGESLIHEFSLESVCFFCI